MQVTMVEGGVASMNAMLMGNIQHTNDSSYVSDLMSNVRLTDTSEYYNNSINTINTIYNSNEALQFNKSIVMEYGALKDQYAMTILTVDTIQDANLRMQEVIMSHPEVNRLHNLGAVDGFANVNADQFIYDRVYEQDVTEEDGMFVYTEIYSDEDELDDIDKHVILKTWDLVSEMLEDGDDPTTGR